MDAVDGYVGDDGKLYRDPCTSRAGLPKQRWPNEKAACYVVELVALGLYRRTGARRNPKKKKLYPYLCPKCEGYHVARCRTAADLERHEAALLLVQKTKPTSGPA